VAVWSLLYHSEKSRAILRELNTEHQLDIAQELLERQYEGAGAVPSLASETEEDKMVQLKSGIRRSLANIRVLLVAA